MHMRFGEAVVEDNVDIVPLLVQFEDRQPSAGRPGASKLTHGRGGIQQIGGPQFFFSLFDAISAVRSLKVNCLCFQTSPSTINLQAQFYLCDYRMQRAALRLGP